MSRKKVIFLFTSILFLMVLVMPGNCSENPTCAVLLFHPDMSASNNFESQMISDKYAELIKRLDMFDVIDFNEAAEILKNKNADDIEKACTDLGCALKVGNKLNADFVIYGIIGSVGNLFSLDTTLVNVAGGNETQHAVYDFKGTQEEFAKLAPAENIKSLFGINEIPAPQTPPAPVAVAAVAEPQITIAAEEKPIDEQQPKKLQFGARLGVGATDDGGYFGGGFEVQYKKLSYQLLLNGDGFVTGFSYYLHQFGNSPFMSVVGAYYDKNHNGVDEIGRIYGLSLGYRICLGNYVKKDFADHINARIGVGAAFVNWDQTEPNKEGIQDGDDEYVPIFELTVGYNF